MLKRFKPLLCPSQRSPLISFLLYVACPKPLKRIFLSLEATDIAVDAAECCRGEEMHKVRNEEKWAFAVNFLH